MATKAAAKVVTDADLLVVKVVPMAQVAMTTMREREREREKRGKERKKIPLEK
jgi:hypothetical protein